MANRIRDVESGLAFPDSRRSKVLPKVRKAIASLRIDPFLHGFLHETRLYNRPALARRRNGAKGGDPVRRKG